MIWIGWLATALFSSSYIFRQPAALRRIQAAAALLWILYGAIIGALPVVVANVIVFAAAAYTSFRLSRQAQPRTAEARPPAAWRDSRAE